jgi:hypothetical protein
MGRGRNEHRAGESHRNGGGRTRRSVSWRDLFRPTTTCGAWRGKVVDGRDKPGHDTGAISAPPSLILVLAPMGAPPVSWPDLVRPSTTCGADGTKVVDGRAKPGHDTEAISAPSALILAPMGAPPVSWPDLVRPSTSCGADGTKVVDGRDNAGHDTGAISAPPALILAPMGAPPVSWPDLVRPSTTCGAWRGKVVDGGTKSGHDTGAISAPPALILAPMGGGPAGRGRRVGDGKLHVFRADRVPA